MNEPTRLAEESAWQHANLDYLRGQLQRLRLLLQRRMIWLRARWQSHSGASDPTPGTVTDAAADLLLIGDSIDDMQAFLAEDANAVALDATRTELEQSLDQLTADLAAVGRPPALETLCRLFGLNSFERDVLLLCAAAEWDQAFPRLFAYVQDDLNLRHATIPLALQLFCGSDPIAHVARSCFAPDGPLRRFQLVATPQTELAQSARPIRIDDRILDYLAGRDRLDERIVDWCQTVPPTPVTPEQQLAVDQLLGVLQSADRPRYAGVCLFGAAGSGRRAVAGRLCEQLGLKLVELAISRLPTNATDRLAWLKLLGREAVLSRFAVYLRLDDSETDPGVAADLLDRLPVFFVAGCRVRPNTRRELLVRKLAPLPAVARAGLWRDALQHIGVDLNGTAAAVAEHFPFGQAQIANTVSTAVARARMQGRDLEEDDVWDSCRERASWELRQLAQPVESTCTWDDIVLPPEVTTGLREIAAQVLQRATVYRRWGFADRTSRGLGISALFAGVSGTGKTLAAEILATHLRLDLYRIDLAGVISKYIGETEKNLKRIFEAAERCGAILFFDEADALFGKRTEVKDSHDRFANIEINYLLQRMESFAGLSILATNRKSDMDRAFLRRLRFLVDFPFPDTQQRMRIWQKSFPPDAPLEELDYDALSRLEIAGGNIRNIALAAAFLAAEQGVPIGMKLLHQAARREYSKMEIMPGDADADRSGRTGWK